MYKQRKGTLGFKDSRIKPYHLVLFFFDILAPGFMFIHLLVSVIADSELIKRWRKNKPKSLKQ